MKRWPLEVIVIKACLADCNMACLSRGALHAGALSKNKAIKNVMGCEIFLNIPGILMVLILNKLALAKIVMPIEDFQIKCR